MTARPSGRVLSAGGEPSPPCAQMPVSICDAPLSGMSCRVGRPVRTDARCGVARSSDTGHRAPTCGSTWQAVCTSLGCRLSLGFLRSGQRSVHDFLGHQCRKPLHTLCKCALRCAMVTTRNQNGTAKTCQDTFVK